MQLVSGEEGFDRAYNEWHIAHKNKHLEGAIEAFQEMNGWLNRLHSPSMYIRFASVCHHTGNLIDSQRGEKSRRIEKIRTQLLALECEYANRAIREGSEADWFAANFLWLQIYARRYDGSVGLFDLNVWERDASDFPRGGIVDDLIVITYVFGRVFSNDIRKEARSNYVNALKRIAEAYSEMSDSDSAIIQKYGFQLWRFLQWAEQKKLHDLELREAANLISKKTAQSARAAEASQAAIDLQSLSIKAQELYERENQWQKDEEDKQRSMLVAVAFGIIVVLACCGLLVDQLRIMTRR